MVAIEQDLICPVCGHKEYIKEDDPDADYWQFVREEIYCPNDDKQYF
ncbi:MAG TPA: hypothetical protein VKA95_10090 [Nitrososphaeraceae archaeon]|nr:hypothetical protein [Nitrososphaeraceae archaeon]